MKPKDLKPVFTWATRHVTVSDGVLYVPAHYSSYREFCLPHWSDEQMFGNDHPVFVEFCSGNGDWVVHRAECEPNVNWVAVEMRFDRVRKIWAKVKNRALKNVFLVCGEAWTAVHHYFPSDSIAGAFVNFPDPWPKLRHRKHRLMKDSFIRENWRVLKAAASLKLVTDDHSYMDAACREMRCHPGFAPAHPAPFYQLHAADYGYSWFSALMQRLERPVYQAEFVKQGRLALC